MQLKLIGLAVLSISYSPAAFASDAEATSVRNAIQQNGKRWHAAKNSVSELPVNQRRRHLGAAPRDGDLPPGTGGGLASPNSGSAATASSGAVPATIDWRNYNGVNYVTPIKDQGSCGDCFVFAPTAALESQVAIAGGGVMVDLSEQAGLDCSGAGSCNGGAAWTASQFLQSTGAPLNSYDPYQGVDATCPAVAGWKANAYKVSGATELQTGSISALENAIATYGPVVVRLAIYDDFYYYTSGVYEFSGAGALDGYHYMTAVGYDSANQYFIVKNSWGTGWGENGYVLMSYANMANAVGFGATENIALYSAVAPAALTVSAPVAGTSVTAGAATTIKWMYSGTPCADVRVELLNGGSVESVISASTTIGASGAGSLPWAVPATLAAGSSYEVNVACTSNASYSSTTGAFTVKAAAPSTPATPASLTLTAPAKGASALAGGTLAVAWKDAGSPCTDLSVTLLKGSAEDAVLAPSVAVSAGAYTARIPAGTAAGATYAIKLACAANAALSSTSDALTVSVPAAPAAPSSFAARLSGTNVDLSWKASASAVGIAAYEIYRNGGLLVKTSATALSFVDTGTVKGNTYSYTVKALSNDRQLSAASVPAMVSR